MDRINDALKQRSGEWVLRLGQFTKRSGWRFTVTTDGWNPTDSASITIRGLFGSEWKVLRTCRVRAGGVDKFGNPDPRSFVAATWPGISVNGGRTPVIPDDLEAVISFDQDCESELTLEALTRAEFPMPRTR